MIQASYDIINKSSVSVDMVIVCLKMDKAYMFIVNNIAGNGKRIPVHVTSSPGHGKHPCDMVKSLWR
jgi:hypothetical protein